MDQQEILQLLQTGLNHHQSGRADEADAAYRKVLAAAPGNVDALHLLGVLEAQRGRLEQGIALLKQATATAPQMGDFHRHLAEVLAQAGRHAEALAGFAAAIQINPRDPAARSEAAASLLSLGRNAEAVEQLRIAAQLLPNDAAALGNYGYGLSRAGRSNEAIEILRRAVEIDANCASAWMQLGEAIWRTGDWDAAVEPTRRAVMLKPNEPRTLIVHGNALQTAGELEEAARVYERASQLDPNSFDAHSNLALTLLKLGEAERALAMYDEILRRWPQITDALANRSLALLTLGDFERGWTEYEARWKSPHFASVQKLPAKRWEGEEIRGKTIVLVSEQGYGDTIQFVRYAPLVAERFGATVIVSCPAEVEPVVKTVRGISQVVRTGTPSAISFDVHAPLASLPGIFRTRLDNIPADVPYVSAELQRVERWRQQLADDENVKVGIVWAGSRAHQNDRARSCRLADFAPVANVAGATLYSLQKGSGEREIDESPFKVIALGEQLHDFGDTAALLECLDLFISIDTSVVHLAGALARPVWTLLPTGPDWRWMLGREDSPWYPTMRLFRQPRFKDWRSVMERVAEQLNGFVQTAKGKP